MIDKVQIDFQLKKKIQASHKKEEHFTFKTKINLKKLTQNGRTRASSSRKGKKIGK